MNKTKTLTATLVILLLIAFSLLPKDKEFCVKNVISPTEIQLNNNEILKFDDIQTFDASYSPKNKELATKLGITEDEAFIIGNLAKYWSQNLLSGRDVLIENGDLIYYKYSYQKKLENSAFGIRNNEPCRKSAFNKLLKSIRHTKYGIFADDKFYPISKEFAQGDFIIIRKSHYYKLFPKAFVKKAKGAKKTKFEKSKIYFKPFSNGNIKIIVSDLTTKLKPDRNCSSDICKEILTNINNTKSSIDMAIYGYSSTPAIEKAIKDAQNRGVKIRLVYDVDAKNQNIYPDTFKFVNLIANSKSDSGLKDSNATMHNKFYIFDNKAVITGSANLSHTDMSGFNSNNIIVINSPDVAKIYKTEFEQMFNGNFHSAKIPTVNNKANNMEIYFSISPWQKFFCNYNI